MSVITQGLRKSAFAALALTLLVGGSAHATPASPPYDGADARTFEYPDLLQTGSTIATAFADVDGGLSVSADVEGILPVGLQIPGTSFGFGVNRAEAEAVATQEFALVGPGTFTITAEFSAITATADQSLATPPGYSYLSNSVGGTATGIRGALVHCTGVFCEEVTDGFTFIYVAHTAGQLPPLGASTVTLVLETDAVGPVTLLLEAGFYASAYVWGSGSVSTGAAGSLTSIEVSSGPSPSPSPSPTPTP